MKILSPAKINLFLQVTGKRSDGYHELVTLMSCIGLYDVLTFHFDTPGISVSCDSHEVPDNEDNLVYKAADLFYDRLTKGSTDHTGSEKSRGVSIFIEKHIPVAAGLGGGSSNAGRTLLYLNQYHGLPFSAAELNGMGLAIGADVPFFLQEKPALATGIGECLEIYKGLPVLWMVVVCPHFSVSTAAVYKKLNLGLTKCKKKLKSFLLNKQRFDPRCHLCNDLEAVTESEYPVIKTIKEALLSHGALGALMTGSGPAIFGLFSDSNTASKASHALFRTHKWKMHLADMITQGTGYQIQDSGYKI